MNRGPGWLPTAAYRLFYFLWFFAVVFAAPFSPKIRIGLLGRWGAARRARKLRGQWERAPFWFHCASSGELEQTLAIVDALKSQAPSERVFITCFSPSGHRALQLERDRRVAAGHTVPWDGADYLPLDFAWTARAFVRALAPKALFIVNREIWPEILSACLRAQVPCYLGAVFLGANPRVRWLKPWLKGLSGIGTVDTQSQSIFSMLLPATHTEVLGDPRVDRVLERQARATFRGTPLEPVFIGASLWQQDWAKLKPALGVLLHCAQPWRVFLVPHEPSPRFVRALQTDLKGLGIQPVLWSKRTAQRIDNAVPSFGTASVILVDTVGELAELYAWADAVLVGGSFRARVHNVLEPAAYGCAIVTGPYINNSAEALALGSQRYNAIAQVCTTEDLKTILRAWAETPQSAFLQGERAKQFVRDQAGSGARYASLLLNRPF